MTNKAKAESKSNILGIIEIRNDHRGRNFSLLDD
ncbi:hypothetical protein T07_10138 [Trichinella nelsoni]|uniref:Uncharacterized protein n=1 Tax=Trichinella nelsoni TaxID=6336 RepID=A0A0V0RC71_9BILA|nr:hypothetical protein T07_10138 [Trichinella nelsoni]